MSLGIIFFFLGTVFYGSYFFPQLISGHYYGVALSCLGLFIAVRRQWLIGSLLCALSGGFFWAALYTQSSLPIFPSYLAGKTVVVKGVVASIPRQAAHSKRFQFVIEQYQLEGMWHQQAMKVQLSWYNQSPALQVGERWQLTVRLKSPRSFANPGSFDYRRWLLLHGVSATGYVRDRQHNQRLSAAGLGYGMTHLRQWLARQIGQQVMMPELAGLIQALTVGIRDGVTQQQWQLFRATGTSHLMAISGLHIGMVAGFIYWLLSFLWRCSGRLCLWWPAPQAAAVGALVVAGLYAALAGFSIPTQRALIMLTVFMGGQLLRRPLVPWHAYYLALGFVMLRDPLACLSPSFYLSFMAVAIIIYAMTGRIGVRGWWWRWGRAQWVVTIGLLPLSLWLFHSVAWLGFIANVIAIPWVGSVVMPLSLLALLLFAVAPQLAHPLLFVVSQSLSSLLYVLQGLVSLSGLGWQHPISHAWVLCAAIGGSLLLLAPRGWPLKWLAPLFLLPLFIVKPDAPLPGDAWFTLLDVGQGLAVVVRTSQHVLLYDTGPRFNDHFDAGTAVVIPFLQQQGLRAIDTMVISHGDQDHSGGVASIFKVLEVKRLLTSVPKRFKRPISSACQQGQHWRWDGVDFEVLSPMATPMPNSLMRSGNNNSCVMMVTAHHQKILLTGDIEQETEQQLIQHLPPGRLKADVLVAPHHGSKTSSTEAFVYVVKPKYVLFSTGYHNRYHFPASVVMRRYLKYDAMVLNTAEQGAIRIKLQGGQWLGEISCYRGCDIQDKKRQLKAA